MPGEVSRCTAAEVAEYVNRAIARGTYVCNLTDPGVRKCLPERVAALVPEWTPPSVAGQLDWDIRAVEQRRAALRLSITDLPPVSAVLVSRRPHLVASMVEQVSRFAYPHLEIVVGLHGAPPPQGLREAAFDRPLSVYEFPAEWAFGSVLNATTAHASGALITKIDDDDFYGPDHLWDLVAAHTYSGATLVGKATTVVYLEALDATVRRVFGTRETFTHRVAGSTMLVSKDDLSQLGGWAAIPRAVDTALINAVRKQGGTIYQPHDIGYLYVRSKDPHAHTWSAAEIGHFLQNVNEQWVGMLEHSAFGTAPI